jgi:hypothetical protein
MSTLIQDLKNIKLGGYPAHGSGFILTPTVECPDIESTVKLAIDYILQLENQLKEYKCNIHDEGKLMSLESVIRIILRDTEKQTNLLRDALSKFKIEEFVKSNDGNKGDKGMIKEAIDLLGFKARDKVNGCTGVITSIAFDLTGCVQAHMNRGFDEKGAKLDNFWHDVQCLEIYSEEGRIIPIPDFDGRKLTPSTYDSGPMEKSSK